jgi:hypothetical protein
MLAEMRSERDKAVSNKRKAQMDLVAEKQQQSTLAFAGS